MLGRITIHEAAKSLKVTRFCMSNRTFRRSAGGIAFGMSLVIALVACAEPESAKATFDAAAWRDGASASMSTDAPRLRMADRLLASGALVGKTRAEVVSMLGQPAETSKFEGYDLVYWLGAERAFISVDSAWLVIGFDRSGEARQVRIVTD